MRRPDALGTSSQSEAKPPAHWYSDVDEPAALDPERRFAEPLTLELGIYPWQASSTGLLVLDATARRKVVWNTTLRLPIHGFDGTTTLLGAVDAFATSETLLTLHDAFGQTLWESPELQAVRGASAEWLVALSRDGKSIHTARWRTGELGGSAEWVGDGGGATSNTQGQTSPSTGAFIRAALASHDGTRAVLLVGSSAHLIDFSAAQRFELSPPTDCSAPMMPQAAAWRPGGANVVVSFVCDSSAGRGSALALYDGRQLRSSALLQHPVQQLEFDRAGTLLVADSRSTRQATAFDMRGDKLRALRQGTASNPHTAVTLLADGSLVDSFTGGLKGRIQGNIGSWSEDGAFLLTYGDSHVQIRAASSGEIVRQLSRKEMRWPDEEPTGVFRRGTSELIFPEAGPLRRPMLWRSEGNIEALAPGTRLPVRDVAFDGRRLVVGSHSHSPTMLRLGSASGPHVTVFDLDARQVTHSLVVQDLQFGVHPTHGVVLRRFDELVCLRQWALRNVEPENGDCWSWSRDGLARLTWEHGQLVLWDAKGRTMLGSVSDADLRVDDPSSPVIVTASGELLAQVNSAVEGDARLVVSRPRRREVAIFSGIREAYGFVDAGAELVVRDGDGLRVVDVEASLLQSRPVSRTKSSGRMEQGCAESTGRRCSAANFGVGTLVTSPAWPTSHSLPSTVAVQGNVAFADEDGVSLLVRGTQAATRLGRTCHERPELLFSQRGDLLIAVCPRWVRAWETKRRRLIYEYQPASALASAPLRAEQLGFEDSSTVLAIADDTVLHLLNLRKGQRLDLAFTRVGGMVGSTEWLAFAPDGTIDGSVKALGLIRYRRPRGLPVALAEAEEALTFDPRRPDLLSDFFSVAQDNGAPRVRAVVEARPVR